MTAYHHGLPSRRACHHIQPPPISRTPAAKKSATMRTYVVAGSIFFAGAATVVSLRDEV